jgi:hypothetical protein
LIDRLLHKQRQSLDELSAEYYGSKADELVDSALDGDFRAIQEIAEAVDEYGDYNRYCRGR